MSTANTHRLYAQAYSKPQPNYGPRFDDYGPMPYQHHLFPPHRVSRRRVWR